MTVVDQLMKIEALAVVGRMSQRSGPAGSYWVVDPADQDWVRDTCAKEQLSRTERRAAGMCPLCAERAAKGRVFCSNACRRLDQLGEVRWLREWVTRGG